jgi:hypothetical protein
LRLIHRQKQLKKNYNFFSIIVNSKKMGMLRIGAALQSHVNVLSFKLERTKKAANLKRTDKVNYAEPVDCGKKVKI